jgi:hypothetical protein
MMRESENQFFLTRATVSGRAFPCRPAYSGRGEQGLKNANRHRGFSSPRAMLLLCGWLALSTPILAQDKVGVDAGLTNAVVLVIRHAEKPDKGSGLSAAGQARAKAYINYFENYTVDSKPLRVDYLFATADSKASQRPRLTLEPFSKAVGLAIHSRFEATQIQQLVNAIQTKPPGNHILISWHHQQIPRLVSALGANSNALFPGNKWPDNVYDWVIQLRYDADGHLIEAKRINEKLMPGDSDK